VDSKWTSCGCSRTTGAPSIPIPKLRVGRSALLVLHGADDDMIVPREAQEAFDAAGTSTKKLVFVPDRGHNDVSASPVYWDAIGVFVRATAS
jgi:fermentation-respiration switch protein FrsA (DUF1100 family)